MARFTKYRTLTNDEILGKVEDSRHVSDIIEELAARLEGAMLSGAADEEFECPYCEAELCLVDNGEGWVLE